MTHTLMGMSILDVCEFALKLSTYDPGKEPRLDIGRYMCEGFSRNKKVGQSFEHILVLISDIREQYAVLQDLMCIFSRKFMD